MYVMFWGVARILWEGGSPPFEEDQAYSANPIRMYSVF